MTPRFGIGAQLLIAAVVAVALPLVLVHGSYGRHLLMLAVILSGLAVSLNLLMGFAGLVSVAHGAFFGIGAYATGLLTSNGHPFLLSVLLGIAIAVVAGLLLGLATLRLRGHYFALGTLAFTMVVVIVLERWDEVTRGARGVSAIPRPAIPGAETIGLSFAEFWPMYLLVVGVLAAFVLISRLLVDSPFGRSLLCIQRNELLGAVFSVDVVKTKLRVFAVSAAMASISGSLYASYIAFVSPNDANFMRSFEAIMFVVVGGAGTTWGPILGTAFVGVLPEYLRGFESLRLLILGLILIAVVRFYPGGLWGGVVRLAAWLCERWRRPSAISIAEKAP